MNKEMKFTVALTLTAPTAAITRVEPKLLTNGSKCEGNINVGLFFDRTNSNRDAGMLTLKHSNATLGNARRITQHGALAVRGIPLLQGGY